MLYEKKIKVNGINVTLNPFSEKRFKELRAINTEINEFINTENDFTFDTLPLEKKESWWRRKADILWSSDVPFHEGFFSSEEFESSLLMESEADFYTKRVYL